MALFTPKNFYSCGCLFLVGEHALLGRLSATCPPAPDELGMLGQTVLSQDPLVGRPTVALSAEGPVVSDPWCLLDLEASRRGFKYAFPPGILHICLAAYRCDVRCNIGFSTAPVLIRVYALDAFDSVPRAMSFSRTISCTQVVPSLFKKLLHEAVLRRLERASYSKLMVDSLTHRFWGCEACQEEREELVGQDMIRWASEATGPDPPIRGRIFLDGSCFPSFLKELSRAGWGFVAASFEGHLLAGGTGEAVLSSPTVRPAAALRWCLLLAMQCPYKAKCQYAYYVCLVTAVVAGTSGVIMGMIGYSIVHVDTLKEPDLTPHKMSTSTKRWGYVARTCPYVSRGLFVLAGMAAGGAIAAAHYTCPPVGDAQWENQWRQPWPRFMPRWRASDAGEGVG
ncbi:unnamed protein product [Prorocentrum cordatum]|uniref:Uncharacterized protein n=1 Tax=Prorocentrum cordatum TaxID=2364126 RepID=A0ABN9YAD1_9DINO|nr:unnamed protein product [Polarella glacialis]